MNPVNTIKQQKQQQSNFQMGVQALPAATHLLSPGSAQMKQTKMPISYFSMEGVWLHTFPAAYCGSGF